MDVGANHQSIEREDDQVIVDKSAVAAVQVGFEAARPDIARSAMEEAIHSAAAVKNLVAYELVITARRRRRINQIPPDEGIAMGCSSNGPAAPVFVASAISSSSGASGSLAGSV